jgi:hypothetical protein
VRVVEDVAVSVVSNGVPSDTGGLGALDAGVVLSL